MSPALELFNRLTATAAEELPATQKAEALGNLATELSDHGNEALTYLTGALNDALAAVDGGDDSANTRSLIRACCDSIVMNIEKRAQVRPGVLNVATVKTALNKVGEVVEKRLPISGGVPAILVKIAEIHERQTAR